MWYFFCLKTNCGLYLRASNAYYTFRIRAHTQHKHLWIWTTESFHTHLSISLYATRAQSLLDKSSTHIHRNGKSSCWYTCDSVCMYAQDLRCKCPLNTRITNYEYSDKHKYNYNKQTHYNHTVRRGSIRTHLCLPFASIASKTNMWFNSRNPAR